MMDLRPDFANVERNGVLVKVSPESVKPGEIIVVKPGEKLPVDGVIAEGASSLNTVALTGESVPRDVVEGDNVISGCINISGVLRIKATKSFGESTAAKIIDLVENASGNKSHSETFITRFAHVYTPIVVFAAIALAFIPPMFAASYVEALPVWLYRALTFLVVSCPCALVISIPLTFFAGIGGASRCGILIKGGNYMDTLAKIKTVVFDKTGTLTRGVFAVNAVHPDMLDEKALLHLAAHVERYSTHPIAAALRQAYTADNDGCTVTDVKEIAGQGVRACINGKTVCVGNEIMMNSVGAKMHTCPKCANVVGTIIHVAIDGKYAGHIVISDEVKPDSAQAIAQLKKLGVAKAVMLTGDKQEVAAFVAKELRGATAENLKRKPCLCVRRHQRCPCACTRRCGHSHGSPWQRCRHRSCRRGAHGRQAVENSQSHNHGAPHNSHSAPKRLVRHNHQGGCAAACRIRSGKHGVGRVCRCGCHGACRAQRHACPQGLSALSSKAKIVAACHETCKQPLFL